MYPSCSESLSFVWDETKHIFERKLLIEAPIIFLRCLHFFWHFTVICHSLIWWNGFSRRHFLYMFSKNITIFKVNCIYFFSWLNPWPWEIVKFEKNWGQICYCVLTPSIATSSFLTAWKLVFFPGGPGPNFHMVQAFYALWVSRVLKYPKKCLDDLTMFFKSTLEDSKNMKEIEFSWCLFELPVK